MLTISSIGVAPRPPQTPVVNAQPVSPAKPSNAVSQGSTGVPVAAAPSGDAGVQTAFVRAAMPPVDPARDAQRADFQKTVLPDATRSAQAGQVAARERYKGELPPEPRTPAQERLDQQIEELIPNVWKASAAAVEVIIGEEGIAAESALEASAQAAAAPAVVGPTYDGQARGTPPANPGSVLDVKA